MLTAKHLLRTAATLAPRQLHPVVARIPVQTPVATIVSRHVPAATRRYHEKDMHAPSAALLLFPRPLPLLTPLPLSALLDHYKNPRNVGSLNKKDPTVASALVGAPACGDVIKLDIRVDPVTNRIVESKFKTFGCGSAIASSSYLTELVTGLSCASLVPCLCVCPNVVLHLFG